MRSMNFKTYLMICSVSSGGRVMTGIHVSSLACYGLPSYAPIIKAALNILFKKLLCVGPSFLWQILCFLDLFLHQNTLMTHTTFSVAPVVQAFEDHKPLISIMGQASPEFQKQNLYYFYCRT